MADEGNGERSELEAKLELPTLGLRRRRRPKKAPEPVAESSAVEAPPEYSVEGPTISRPEPTDLVVEAPPATDAPAAEEARTEEPTEPAPAIPTAAASAHAAQEAPTELPEPATAAPPEPAPDDEPTTLLPDVAPEVAPEPRARRRPRLPARPSLPSLPALPTVRLSGRVAAVVAGVVVGLTGVLLVYLSEQGCAVVRNTTSCGGAGVVLIVAIFALMVLEGSVLLRAFVVNDALSTSFLGVGVIAMVTMLFLLGVVGHWYMVIVIPLVAAAGFLLAWWVTSQFSNEEPVEREPHLDV